MVLLAGCSLFSTHPVDPQKPCNSSEASPIADGGTAVVLAIITGFAIIEATGEYGDSEAASVGVLSGIGALIYGGSAIYGARNVSACQRHERAEYDAAVLSRQQTQRTRTPASRPEAWKLTQEAAASARSGDCKTALSLGEVVRELDIELYRTVFMRDAAIGTCMGATEIPIEPPSATPATQPPSATP